MWEKNRPEITNKIKNQIIKCEFKIQTHKTGIKEKVSKKEIIISGLALAIPNFASIYFLNHALHQQIPGSIAFPILNCSVILISVLVSILFYGEKFTTKKFIGLLLALLAVFIISKYL